MHRNILQMYKSRQIKNHSSSSHTSYTKLAKSARFIFLLKGGYGPLVDIIISWIIWQAYIVS
jgi:hypothetical protein